MEEVWREDHTKAQTLSAVSVSCKVSFKSQYFPYFYHRFISFNWPKLGIQFKLNMLSL